MKKLVSLLMAVSMTASLPVYPAHAEDTPDLESLAMSLGAETDYLSVPNYYYPATDLSVYYYFMPLSNYQTISLNNNVAEYSDTSLGASILSVLDHNGVIKNDGDFSLSEINDVRTMKETIFKYQNVRNDKRFELYRKYLLKSQTLAQKADSLVSTAEKCMSEGRYFLIMYSSIKTNLNYDEVLAGRKVQGHQVHSAVGIGITDGSWTFNGKTYNKCILTLDPFNIDKENDAFSEDTCIYINSETKEYYVPKISECAENDLHIIAIDDDQLLSSGNTDVSDNITGLDTISGKGITEITYNDENGNTVVLNKENDFLDNYHTSPNNHFLLKGSNFNIYTASSNNADYIDISNKDRTIELTMEKSDSEIFYNDNTIKFTRKDCLGKYRDSNDPLKYQLFVDGEPHYYINGETFEETEFTKTDDGVICSGGQVAFKVGKHNPDNAEDPYTVIHYVAFNSDGKVFVKYDENDGFKLFSDIDDDGIFEHEVQKGDINCDGRVDAVDVSMILEAYSYMSLNEDLEERTIYTCVEYADINNDGEINAVDVSALLEIYSENSTK